MESWQLQGSLSVKQVFWELVAFCSGTGFGIFPALVLKFLSPCTANISTAWQVRGALKIADFWSGDFVNWTFLLHTVLALQAAPVAGGQWSTKGWMPSGGEQVRAAFQTWMKVLQKELLNPKGQWEKKGPETLHVLKRRSQSLWGLSLAVSGSFS